MAAITGIIDKVSQLVSVKFELFKLESQGQIANIVSRIIGFLVVFMLASLAILFLAFGLAYFLNTLFGSPYLGFLVTGFVFVLITFLVYSLVKSGKLSSAIEEAILGETGEENE